MVGIGPETSVSGGRSEWQSRGIQTRRIGTQFRTGWQLQGRPVYFKTLFRKSNGERAGPGKCDYADPKETGYCIRIAGVSGKRLLHQVTQGDTTQDDSLRRDNKKQGRNQRRSFAG